MEDKTSENEKNVPDTERNTDEEVPVSKKQLSTGNSRRFFATDPFDSVYYNLRPRR